MDRPEIILAPGPTPIPPEVLLAQGSPLVYHRGPGFGTADARRHGAPEGAVSDGPGRRAADDLIGHGRAGIRRPELFSPGDEVLIPSAGFFSERWRSLATAMGLAVRTVDHEWGEKVDAVAGRGGARGAPGEGGPPHPLETSTGVIQPIEELARVANEAGAMVVVDVVCSLGAVPFDFDGWGIDVAVGGSQKALSASPGIAFVAISERAWEAHVATNLPGSTSTGRSTAASPNCPIRRTRGRRRSA